MIEEEPAETSFNLTEDSKWEKYAQRINPQFVIIAILFIFFALFMFFQDWYEDYVGNVSECYIKFKELGCSLIRPSEECRTYI